MPDGGSVTKAAPVAAALLELKACRGSVSVSADAVCSMAVGVDGVCAGLLLVEAIAIKSSALYGNMRDFIRRFRP